VTESSVREIEMNKLFANKDTSLRNFFVIAYLIPIAGTLFVILKDGLQSDLVTN